MTKKLLFSTIALLFCAAVSAQQVTERSEISVSYGLAPVTSWIDAYNDALIEAFSGVKLDPTSWGTVTLGYNYRLTRKFSVGVQVSYSSNKDDVSIKNMPLTTIHNRYWSVMPNIKHGWLNIGKIATFYSRIGAGISFRKSKSDVASGSESHFAFQFSPIGIEIGGNIAAYAEVGLGMSGCALFGARYRF